MPTRTEFREFTILPSINDEREYQIEKHGKYRGEQRDIATYIFIMETILVKAKKAVIQNTDNNFYALLEILQAVSVGIACMENHGVPLGRTGEIVIPPKEYTGL